MDAGELLPLLQIMPLPPMLPVRPSLQGLVTVGVALSVLVAVVVAPLRQAHLEGRPPRHLRPPLPSPVPWSLEP